VTTALKDQHPQAQGVRPHPNPLPEGEGKRPKLWAAWLALILLLATGLRIYHLNAKSYWFDEFASVELACGRGYAQDDMPVNQLIPEPLTIIDIHNARPIHEIWFAEKTAHAPPLYATILRLWGEVFGLGPISGRAFSLVMSVGSIAAIFFLMRDLTGTTRAGLWCALIMALAGAQIEFAQEARPYTLLMLEALLAAAALARIERRGSASPSALVLLTLALLSLALTHYFAIGTILALAIYAGVRLRGAMRRKVVVCFALAAVGWGILGAPLALTQAHNVDVRRTTAFLDDHAPRHLTRTLTRAALLPVRYFTEPSTDSIPPAMIGAVAFLLAILLALRRRDLLLWGLWLWLTILPIFVLDVARHTQHLDLLRYTLLASPALYAMVATATDRAKSPWMRSLAPALITLACVAALPRAYEVWWKADWRGIAKVIDHNARPGDVVVFFRGDAYDDYPPAAYLHTSYYRQSKYGPVVLMHDPPDAELLKQLHSAPGVLVLAFSPERLAESFDHAQLQWLGYEHGAGGLWRAKW
jgi:uncharacterized membrane protein